jgi:hypothetical protein
MSILSHEAGLIPTVEGWKRNLDILAGPACAQLFDWVRTAKLKVNIGRRYPLGDAAQAHIDTHSRRTTGKLLLTSEDVEFGGKSEERGGWNYSSRAKASGIANTAAKNMLRRSS